jgi:hypothetical protein
MQFKSFQGDVSMQSNTTAVANQPVNFPSFSFENRPSDSLSIRDGRFVGHDGFVVPRNFEEFLVGKSRNSWRTKGEYCYDAFVGKL